MAVIPAPAFGIETAMPGLLTLRRAHDTPVLVGAQAGSPVIS